jgi:hypothetical protein
MLGKLCNDLPPSPLILLSRLPRANGEVKDAPIYASTVSLLPPLLGRTFSDLLYSRFVLMTVHMELLSST